MPKPRSGGRGGNDTVDEALGEKLATKGAHSRGIYHARLNSGAVGWYTVYLVCRESSVTDNQAFFPS